MFVVLDNLIKASIAKSLKYNAISELLLKVFFQKSL